MIPPFYVKMDIRKIPFVLKTDTMDTRRLYRLQTVTL